MIKALGRVDKTLVLYLLINKIKGNNIIAATVKRNKFNEKGLIIPETFPEAKKEPATIIVASKI